jgi:poly-gamma-glutamate synthesis protein (capsule biosynthesis protein)
MVTLALIGDVMLGRGVNEEIAYRPPESLWGTALPVLQAPDGVIANLECAITQHTQKCRIPKVFHFRANPEAVNVLRSANIRCVSLANNHTLDFQEQGLLDTLHHLDSVGIRYVGAGRNLSEATTPLLIEIGGLKIGIIAFTDNQPEFAADRDRPGTHYLEIRADPATIGLIASGVHQVRHAGAKLILLSVHWGPNMVTRPPRRFQAFAHAVVECGVDLVHGHSAHLFQGIERYRQGLILYDTGDFLDDYAVDPELRNDWSFIFLVEATETGLQRLQMRPVQLHYARVDLATGKEFDHICDRMQQLSTMFGTELIKTSEGLGACLQ